MTHTFIHRELKLHVVAQSPAIAVSELQAICLFESGSAPPFSGSLRAIDTALQGQLAQLNEGGAFSGRWAETLVFKPPPASLGASRLLVIGLGRMDAFSPAQEEALGRLLVNEAARLGVSHPFFAPTLLDGGFDAATAGNVTQPFVRGVVVGVGALRSLTARGLDVGSAITDVTLLTGKERLESAAEALCAALKEL